MLRITLSLAAAAFLALTPSIARAGKGAEELSMFIHDYVILEALDAFWGIAAVFILYYSLRLILEAQKESALTEARQSVVQVFFGFGVIASAAAFAATLESRDILQLDSFIGAGAEYIKNLATGVFVLVITLSGFAMAITMGDSGAFQKWTKVLIGNCIGVIVIVLADIGVTAVRDPAGGAASISTELVGLANFILTIFGFACGAALIVAGVLLIVSVEEGLKDRAKKIVFGTLVTLAIVLVIRVLLQTFFATPT